ncbi:hypothetical protein ABAC402_11085 [Asticcacaulis sp. AC402]|nr:hypothetical protein ABAC402_11085 [Asticcacaulis sp. AC402]
MVAVWRFLTVVFLVAVVLGGGLFYAAPLITFYDIRSSAKTEDVAALAKLVSFDSVRTGLKAQLLAGKEGVAAPPPSAINDPVGATGNVLKDVSKTVGKAWDQLTNPKAPKAPLIPVVDVDSYLKPKSLLALTYGAGEDAPKFDPASFEGKPPMPKYTFMSLERARLTVDDAERGTTTFTFERKSLTHWELTHIALPKTGEEAAAASPAG